ncbi:MAG TPA: hypothetical protein VK684_02825, partial [Edaphobacter sp.]|nr:hypothetical protein [Edaphobacter sp.]
LDVLHLGSDARMNTPAATYGNWTWRYHSNALHPDFATQLATLMEMTDRDGYVPPAEDEEPQPALEAGKGAGESQKRAQSAASV